MAFQVPNHTQTPNALFDVYLPELGYAELKVTLAVVRKTFGWHKHREKISLSQLQEVTGLTREAVSDGVQAALARGTLRRTPAGGSFSYELVLSEAAQPSLDGGRATRPPSRATRPATGRPARPAAGRPARPTQESRKETEKERPPAPAPQGGGHEDLLERIHGHLRESCSEYSYGIWLSPLRIVAVEDGRLVLDAPDNVRSWMIDRYLPAIKRAVERVDAALEVVFEETAGERAEREAQEIADARRSRRAARARAA